MLTFQSVAMAAEISQDVWRDVAKETLPTSAPKVSSYRALRLDLDRIRAGLSAVRHNRATVRVPLPLPEGGSSTFELADSLVMPDALQDRFPDVVSLVGRDANGRTARVDSSPRGLQAMVFDADGLWIVRPQTDGLDGRYLSFRRADLSSAGRPFQCNAHDDHSRTIARATPGGPTPMTSTGAIERVFRTAIAADHTYVAAIGGGTVAGGLAAIVTAMNRVNQVYETELGVHMTLIPNEQLIIFPNAGSDPYNGTVDPLGQNQLTVDALIGNANYDIGHLFSTGGGGVASLYVTCADGGKARGTTGLDDPEGDAFYIDFVAHEMGHQFGGLHTFNGINGSCSATNRTADAAYEPGSGSTIMAYAGICDGDNLQPHSDPYFHAVSLAEINDWLAVQGGACAAQTVSTDAPPVINTASLTSGFTIPRHTPFTLSGTATDADADNDSLTYNWEEYDLGDATIPQQGDIGNGPIFRSFTAAATGQRTFPLMSTVLGFPPLLGESWPETTRDLTFRLTVRDNHGVPIAPQYGASTSADGILIHVDASAGPFVLTRPNAREFWARGESQRVTWNVAGTNAAPVNCADVAIDLSLDAGSTFTRALSASTPNTGSATIVVPPVADTDTARVRVSCRHNVFFDVSDANFSIHATGEHLFADGFEGPAPATQPVLDPGFEATTATAGSNPFWSGFDSNVNANGGSPFYNVVPVHAGNWGIWFGSWHGGAETQTASQGITIPVGGPRYLHYWRLFDSVPDGPGQLSVSIDGIVVETTNLSAMPVDTAFVRRSVDISAYADGTVHTLLLTYEYPDAAGHGIDGEVFIDDVTVDASDVP
ncbi:MAG: reprolysin-like metallopeptidase [Dokdonella sp.]